MSSRNKKVQRRSRNKKSLSTKSRKSRSTGRGSRSACNSSGKKLKLLSIKRSPKKDKKLVATFCKNGRVKQIHFGAAGYKNYCGPSGKGKDCHNSAERRRRYLARHKSRENFNKPDSAGSLSAHVLWGKGSVSSNISAFKRKFNL